MAGAAARLVQRRHAGASPAAWCSRAPSTVSFLALDAATGKELWSYDNQAATMAGPVSYAVDGSSTSRCRPGTGRRSS